MKYGLDDRPPLGALLLYGLQWWVVSLPSIVIMGIVVSRLQFPAVGDQVWYLQKMFAVMGISMTIQVLWGHRLPLIIGPAAILLVGIAASSAPSPGALYFTIFICGLLMALAGFSGLVNRLRAFFTPRIVAVVLLLIAMTLMPTIIRLIFSGPPPDSAGNPAHGFHLIFALGLAFAMLLLNDRLPGVGKAMTVLIGLGGGVAVYCLFMGAPEIPALPEAFSPEFRGMSLELHPGTLISFLFCFMALTINELGSTEAIGQMLKVDGMPRRIRLGMGFAGLTNAAAGGLGVMGAVDYSMSAGVIAATGNASRLTLIPAGLGLLACAFFPSAILLFQLIPNPVMGALLLYLMGSQLASGLTMLTLDRAAVDFTSAITVGLPLMVGLLAAFAPPAVFESFPEILRPLAGNGFVMGTLSVVLLEHVIFRRRLRAVDSLAHKD